MDATSGDGRPRGPSIAARILDLPARLRSAWSQTLFPAPSEPPSGFAPSWMGLLALLLIAAPVLLLNLSYPLLEPDENRNAQIALEMFQSGDYVVPTRIGQPYLYKPPLLFWLVATSYRLCGVNEWAARLPVALAALATVAMTYWLGRQAVGRRAAWIGALLLLLTGGFVLAGRFLLMDMLLTMCATAGLLTALAGATTHKYRAVWWLAAGVACGIGILAKGPVALVLVVPPLVAASWLTPQDITMRWWGGLLLIGTAVLIALPWYVLVSMRHPDFPQTFLWTQNLQRYTTGIDHQQPIWFYIPVLMVGMLPASLLFPPLAIFLGSRREELRRLRSPSLGFLALAAVWIVFFFSLSSSKLPTYILPAIPCLCLLFGRLVDGVLLATEVSRARFTPFMQHLSLQFPRNAAVGLGTLGIAGLVADVLLGRDAWLGIVLSGLAGAGSLGLLAIAIAGRVRSTPAGWSLVGAAAIASMTLGFNDLYPEFAASRSRIVRARTEIYAARVLGRAENAPVALYGTLSEGASFYLDDRGLRKFAKDQHAGLIALAQDRPRIWVVSTRSNAAYLEEELPPTHQLIRAPDRLFMFALVDLRSPAERSLAKRPVVRPH